MTGPGRRLDGRGSEFVHDREVVARLDLVSEALAGLTDSITALAEAEAQRTTYLGERIEAIKPRFPETYPIPAEQATKIVKAFHDSMRTFVEAFHIWGSDLVSSLPQPVVNLQERSLDGVTVRLADKIAFPEIPKLPEVLSVRITEAEQGVFPPTREVKAKITNLDELADLLKDLPTPQVFVSGGGGGGSMAGEQLAKDFAAAQADQRVLYDYEDRTDGNAVYIGLNQQGVATSAETWVIRQSTYDDDAREVDMQVLIGAWDERASLPWL